MKAFVVDTNVPLVANRKADHAGLDCVLACVAALEQVKDAGRIVLVEGQGSWHENAG